MQEEVFEQVEAVVEKTQEEILAEAIEARLEVRLKEEREKIARGMLNEGRQRERNEFNKLFEKHGIEIGETPEATITSLFTTMQQLQAHSEESKRAAEEEILTKTAAASTERDQALQERDAAIASRNAYIIQSEIVNAIGTKAVDVQTSMQFLLQEYSVEVNNDAQVTIRNKSGAIVHNEANEPASMEWVVASFLERHPYLARATNRRTDAHREDITSGSLDFLKKPRGNWSQSELQRTLQMVAEGKIVNRDGKWVVR